jgi:hypothetical protein
MQNARYQEFPKKMHHKDHRPATWHQDPGKDTFMGREARIKTVEFMPDRIASNVGEEQILASQGYRPVNMNMTEDDYQIAVLQQISPEHKFQKFPKWKYHPIEASRIVNSQAEEDGLGEGWGDYPIVATEDDYIPEPVAKSKGRERAA